MRANGRRKSGPAPVEIAEFARGRLRVFCRISRLYVTRLDALATRAREEIGARAGRVPRADLLRALILPGLDLAIQQVHAPAISEGFEVRLPYDLTPQELDRLEHYRRSVWSYAATRPAREKAHGALVRLALLVAETKESFLTDTLVPLLLLAKEET
jgi:hypothetical protein